MIDKGIAEQKRFGRIRIIRFKTETDLGTALYLFLTKLRKNGELVEEARKIALELNIPDDIFLKGMEHYEEALEAGKVHLLDIKNHRALVAGCIFIALRVSQDGPILSMQELSVAFQVNPRAIIQALVDFKVYTKNKKREPRRPSDYVAMLIQKISLDLEVIEKLKGKRVDEPMEAFIGSLEAKAEEILETLPERVLKSRNPFIMAGASLYAADRVLSKENDKKRILTQKLLAKATGISEHSIGDHFSSVLKPFLKNEI